jgi:hypothetical protein
MPACTVAKCPFSYATALQVIALFGLSQARLPALLGAVAFIIMSGYESIFHYVPLMNFWQFMLSCRPRPSNMDPKHHQPDRFSFILALHSLHRGERGVTFFFFAGITFWFVIRLVGDSSSSGRNVGFKSRPWREPKPMNAKLQIPKSVLHRMFSFFYPHVIVSDVVNSYVFHDTLYFSLHSI